MSLPGPTGQVHFGEFTLDLETAELRNNGRKFTLQDQPFQILQILLEQPGRLVTRDELKKRLWPSDTFVDFDHGLNKAVNRLREALDDSADHPKFIETLPRRGYRFVFPVSVPAEQKAVDGGRPTLGHTASPAVPTVKPIPPELHRRWLGIMAGILVLSLFGSGVYWFSKREPPAPRQFKLQQITFNSPENDVRNGAISPNGKYLAYVDRKGINIRLLETSETRVVPDPDAIRGSKVDWEICPWFPDSTRFLVNEHPEGKGDESTLSSQDTSIWIVSLLGGSPRKLRDNAIAYAISPDGTTISFGTNKGDLGDREIWLMGVNGENARKLYEADENGAMGPLMWFPHGQRVVYITTNKSGDTLVTRELKGGRVSTILSPPDLEKMNDFAILPGGRFLYTLQEPDAVGNSCNFWIMRLDERTGALDNKPVRLTNWGGDCMGDTSWTADGKKLAFKKWKTHFTIFVADITPNGTSISGIRHLTLTESWDFPTDWTRDGKGVIFQSNRNGHFGIFKQLVNEDSAEPLVMDAFDPRVTPDGEWVVYSASTNPSDKAASIYQGAPIQVRRVPIMGGPSEFVLTARRPGWPMCAKLPSNLCTIMEFDDVQKQFTVTAFNPMIGRGQELARIDADPKKYFTFDLSPDGTRLAYSTSPGLIHILSLRGQPPQEFRVKGFSHLGDIEWADATALFVSQTVQGGADLLRVDMEGNARVLWQQHGGSSTYGRPSPDGRHLALVGWSYDSNLWVMENF